MVDTKEELTLEDLALITVTIDGFIQDSRLARDALASTEARRKCYAVLERINHMIKAKEKTDDPRN